MCCMLLAEIQDAKKSPSGHHRTALSGCIFATKACIDNRKKLLKQQYLTHMSPQYGKLRPSNSWDCFGCLVHPSNFNGFRILPSLLQRRHSPEANQTLLNVWPSPVLVHYICIFGGFRLSQNSLYVQVLCSPILAALLHNTWAAGISQTLRRGTRNGIMQLSLLTIFNRGRHLYFEGGHHVGHRPTF